MATPKKTSGLDRKPRAKATTPEARENQLVSLAYDAAEQQLREGTASAMVIVHFLKLKTSENKLKEEKLRKEVSLLETKTEMYGSQQRTEELYEKALKYFKAYQGQDVDLDGEDEDL